MHRYPLFPRQRFPQVPARTLTSVPSFFVKDTRSFVFKHNYQQHIRTALHARFYTTLSGAGRPVWFRATCGARSDGVPESYHRWFIAPVSSIPHADCTTHTRPYVRTQHNNSSVVLGLHIRIPCSSSIAPCFHLLSVCFHVS